MRDKLEVYWFSHTYIDCFLGKEIIIFILCSRTVIETDIYQYIAGRWGTKQPCAGGSDPGAFEGGGDLDDDGGGHHDLGDDDEVAVEFMITGMFMTNNVKVSIFL